MQFNYRQTSQNPHRFYMKAGGGWRLEDRWYHQPILPVEDRRVPEASLLRCETWDLYHAVKTSNGYKFTYDHNGRRDRNATVDGALLLDQLMESYLVVLWKNSLHVLHCGSADIWNPKTKKYERLTTWLESTQKGKQ